MTRQRLVDGNGVPTIDGARAMFAAIDYGKLSPAQRRRVREMVEDEGCSRAEAVAWVYAFEPDPESAS